METTDQPIAFRETQAGVTPETLQSAIVACNLSSLPYTSPH